MRTAPKLLASTLRGGSGETTPERVPKHFKTVWGSPLSKFQRWGSRGQVKCSDLDLPHPAVSALGTPPSSPPSSHPRVITECRLRPQRAALLEMSQGSLQAGVQPQSTPRSPRVLHAWPGNTPAHPGTRRLPLAGLRAACTHPEGPGGCAVLQPGADPQREPLFRHRAINIPF